MGADDDDDDGRTLDEHAERYKGACLSLSSFPPARSSAPRSSTLRMHIPSARPFPRHAASAASFFPLPPTPLTPDRSRTPPCASPPAFRHNLHPQPFHPSYLPPARPMTGCNPLVSSMSALAISPAPPSLT